MSGSGAAIATAVVGTIGYLAGKSYIDGCRVQLTAAPQEKSRILAKPSGGDALTLRSALESLCPSLTDPSKAYMIPTPYLFTGMIQTVHNTFKARKRDAHTNIVYDRETFITKDKGTISVDWYPAFADVPADTRPVVVVMSGVGGSSQEYHMRYLSKALASGPHKYRVAVMNHRGCSRTPITSPKMYNLYYTDDFRDIVAYVAQRLPDAPIMGLGFSMGANVLTKYMGEEGESCPLAAGIAICCPFDARVAGEALNAPGFLNDKVFQPNLTATLKRLVLRNEDVIQSGEIKYDMDAIRKVKRMHEFDTLFTARAFGFSSCWEYYDAASSSQYVDAIAVPYLAINSLDDPVTPSEGIPREKFETNPNAALALVAHGGHIGFYSGMSPRIWYVDPVNEFFGAVVQHKDY